MLIRYAGCLCLCMMILRRFTGSAGMLGGFLQPLHFCMMSGGAFPATLTTNAVWSSFCMTELCPLLPVNGFWLPSLSDITADPFQRNIICSMVISADGTGGLLISYPVLSVLLMVWTVLTVVLYGLFPATFQEIRLLSAVKVLAEGLLKKELL